MLFNSIEFLIFLPIVAAIYYLVPARLRWLILLGASYFFVIRWEPAYLLLILTTTAAGYLTARKMENEENNAVRRRYFLLGIIINLGLLIAFKYFNFINDNIRSLFGLFGAGYPVPDLKILAPLGISFYTLQVIGYSIDVFQRRMGAEKSPGAFALFVSFFPQLAAGPIERARNMLPQYKASHTFDYERTVTGLLRIAWGFFKKLVVADRLALFVNAVYNDPTQYTGAPLIIATYAFAIQIYCDFSAYSDIAIGAARIFGINLMENFSQPYFSKSVSEFWRNWHISLSTWFRDYVFFPLRRSMLKSNVWNAGTFLPLAIPPLATMLLSGLWHGPDWGFVVWGGLHGVFILFDTVWNQYLRSRFGFRKVPESLKAVLQIIATFNILSFTWVFFRANSLSDAVYVLQNLFVNLRLQATGITWIMPGGKFQLAIAILAAALVGIVDVLQYRKTNLRAFALRRPLWMRWAVYFALIFVILMFGKFGVAEFIYVQF